jgi:hypothetical protein
VVIPAAAAAPLAASTRCPGSTSSRTDAGAWPAAGAASWSFARFLPAERRLRSAADSLSVPARPAAVGRRPGGTESARSTQETIDRGRSGRCSRSVGAPFSIAFAVSTSVPP